MNQSSSQKLLKRGQNTPKTLKTTVFSSKSLYFEAQNNKKSECGEYRTSDIEAMQERSESE